MWLPPSGSRVVVAMSGGVDSSVTAAWLKQRGYDVIGVSLQLHDASQDHSNKYGTCCTLSDIQDARQVAEKIGIPFYVTDMEVEFQKEVIDDFLSEYMAGRTPNPCVRCNEKVKFSRLLDWALDLGADYLATGHFAIVQKHSAELDEFELHRGVSPEKDQSYFLFSIRQADLSRCFFPMGTLTKDEVRRLARDFELGTANKPDSQEICFVQGGKYQEFVEKNVPPEARRAGIIKDEMGNAIGEHQGLYQFTIGQRKGLGVASLEPRYVLAIDAADNSVTVGRESALYRRECFATKVNWINRVPPNGASLTGKIRYRASASPCTIDVLEGVLEGVLENVLDSVESSCGRSEPAVSDCRVRVKFEEPQRAISPGQAIVFYDGTRVAGGGWIERAL